MKRSYASSTLRLLALVAFSAALGCSNYGSRAAKKTDEPLPTALPPVKTGLRVSSVQVTPGENSLLELRLDASKATTTLNKICATTTETGSGVVENGCECQLKWKEKNASTGVVLNRSLRAKSIEVHSQAILCSTPKVFDQEIKDGTVVTATVAPSFGSAVQFEVTGFNFVKGEESANSGDFSVGGANFSNIHRYACHETAARGMTLKNKIKEEVTESGAFKREVAMSTNYCAKLADGSTVSNDGDFEGGKCTSVQNAPTRFTAQAYYYNLYIPSKRQGQVENQQDNQRFSCPKVKEDLMVRFDDGTPRINPRPFPLDTHFSLATEFRPEYPVGVVAPAVLGNSADPTTKPTGCFPSEEDGSSGSASGSGISYQCIGFAKKANGDGSCSPIIDGEGSSKVSIPTYRLRRYVALYPVTFDTNGRVVDEVRGTDVIYVLDRPVLDSAGKQIATMRGPKPCQFSYFDHQRVLGLTNINDPTKLRSAFKATNFPGWNGLNVDGTHFPNIDFETDSSVSCSAALPIVQYDPVTGTPTAVTTTTTHPTNPGKYNLGGGAELNFSKVYVRPQKPWSPKYVEDTQFEACAPLSYSTQNKQFEVVDPPLNFARDGEGQVSWCAAAYPTQIDMLSVVDKPPGSTASTPVEGALIPFTSSGVKNSISKQCKATPVTLPAGYPSNGPARHLASLLIDQFRTGAGAPQTLNATQTCDRTIVPPPDGIWKNVPLLAQPSDITAMLQSDSSYRCEITYDGNHPEGRAKNRKSPKFGCCAQTRVSLPATDIAGTPNPNDTAHLEPDVELGRRCHFPQY